MQCVAHAAGLAALAAVNVATINLLLFPARPRVFGSGSSNLYSTPPSHCCSVCVLASAVVGAEVVSGSVLAGIVVCSSGCGVAVVSWAAHVTGQASLTSCTGEPGGNDTFNALVQKLTSARHVASSAWLVLVVCSSGCGVAVVSWAAHVTGQASLMSCTGEPGGNDTLNVVAQKLTSARHDTSSP